MAEESETDRPSRKPLQRLISEHIVDHNISVRGLSYGRRSWPSAHNSKLKAIKAIGEIKYENYAIPDHDNSKPDDKPWRKVTKSRATWLAEEAEKLSQQSRNEAGWRLRLEDCVIKRLLYGVSW